MGIGPARWFHSIRSVRGSCKLELPIRNQGMARSTPKWTPEAVNERHELEAPQDDPFLGRTMEDSPCSSGHHAGHEHSATKRFDPYGHTEVGPNQPSRADKRAGKARQERCKRQTLLVRMQSRLDPRARQLRRGLRQLWRAFRASQTYTQLACCVAWLMDRKKRGRNTSLMCMAAELALITHEADLETAVLRSDTGHTALAGDNALGRYSCMASSVGHTTQAALLDMCRSSLVRRVYECISTPGRALEAYR